MAEETNKSPTEAGSFNEVSSSEYSKAYNLLRDYVKNKNNESIDDHRRLAETTLPLGSYLVPLIQSEGKRSSENKENHYINGKGVRKWINPSWGVPEHTKIDVGAVHKPEDNCIHISGSTEDHGYELFIPIDINPQSIFVRQTQSLPRIEVWDKKGDLSFKPLSERDRKRPDYLIMYSECLYESVSNLFNMLPKPTTT